MEIYNLYILRTRKAGSFKSISEMIMAFQTFFKKRLYASCVQSPASAKRYETKYNDSSVPFSLFRKIEIRKKINPILYKAFGGVG